MINNILRPLWKKKRCRIILVLVIIGLSVSAFQCIASWKREKSQRYLANNLRQVLDSTACAPTPTYSDDQYCYFFTADEGCVYRYNDTMEVPAQIISGVQGITVLPQGILVQYAGTQGLYLWKDGMVCYIENSNIDFFGGEILTVGDYLFYNTIHGVCIRQMFLDEDALRLGDVSLQLPDCLYLQYILWADANAIWYLTADESGMYRVGRMDWETCAYETTDTLTRPSKTQRHLIWMAVSDGVYDYRPSGSAAFLYTMNLETGEVETREALADDMTICAYRTSTGECLFQTLNRNGSIAESTVDLQTGEAYNFLGLDTAQTVYGDAVVANRYDIELDTQGWYRCYHRTVVYRKSTGAVIWESNGSVYYEDYS